MGHPQSIPCFRGEYYAVDKSYYAYNYTYLLSGWVDAKMLAGALINLPGGVQKQRASVSCFPSPDLYGLLPTED